MKDKTLVMGASGFLGSHVCKQLLAQGREVRVMLRRSGDTRALDGLPLEISYGDVHNRPAMTDAMTGCSSVFYCVVDTRAWLRDPAPLYQNNVEGLRNALEVARHQPLNRFVFTSSFTTIGRAPQSLANESHPFNDPKAPPYMQCRAEAERLLFNYYHRDQLPVVACCVGNTYGPGDFAPTPHGKPLAMNCSWRNFPLDNRRAREELGWEPRPVEDSIRAAVAFYQAQYRLSRS